MTASDDNAVNERHRVRMERKKAVVDTKIAAATCDQGVLLIHTGNGKGKSSAGFGMLARALGHGMHVGVVQFIKGATRPSMACAPRLDPIGEGAFSTGEEAFFRRFPEVDYHVMGEGYTWEIQDRQRDIAAAHVAWLIAATMLGDPTVHLVLLDELNIALKHHYIALDDVIVALKGRPPMQHVVVTGRGTPQALIDIADTVTEMVVVKHAFAAGVRAQKGVEL
jgi:cob(I)alamin adenosyltransferase